MTLPGMYFINKKINWNVFYSELENEKANVVLSLIVFIELNFTAAFLLIRQTWNDWFAGKVLDREF